MSSEFLFSLYSNCKSRDKLCMLYQYIIKLSSDYIFSKITFEKDSIHLIKLLSQYENLKFIEKSFSNARKIFRFLNWIDNINLIYYYFIFKSEKKDNLNDILNGVMNCFSFLYHIFDNLVWYSNLGLINEYFLGDFSIKTIKRGCSLIRILFKIILDTRKYMKIKNILRKVDDNHFFGNEKLIQVDDKSSMPFDNTNSLSLISKVRKYKISLFHSYIRFLMLIYSLNTPAINRLNPILYDILAIFHSLISLYKLFKYSNDIQIKQDKSNPNLENEYINRQVINENLDVINETESKYNEVLIEFN